MGLRVVKDGKELLFDGLGGSGARIEVKATVASGEDSYGFAGLYDEDGLSHVEVTVTTEESEAEGGLT